MSLFHFHNRHFFSCILVQVVELLSTVIEHLVKGEVMQMRPASTGKDTRNSQQDHYLCTLSLYREQLRIASMYIEHFTVIFIEL